MIAIIFNLIKNKDIKLNQIKWVNYKEFKLNQIKWVNYKEFKLNHNMGCRLFSFHSTLAEPSYNQLGHIYLMPLRSVIEI